MPENCDVLSVKACFVCSVHQQALDTDYHGNRSRARLAHSPSVTPSPPEQALTRHRALTGDKLSWGVLFSHFCASELKGGGL